MSTYKQTDLQHFHTFIAKLLCFFLTCYLFLGKACYLQWVKTEAAHSDQIITFQYNCTWPAICNWPSSAKNSKAKSSAVAQCSMTWVRPLLKILCMWFPKQKENLVTFRKTNGNLSAAFSEPLSWGRKLSVGRRRASSFLWLPLSCHSFSSVQSFLHRTAMNGLVCVYLGCMHRT